MDELDGFRMKLIPDDAVPPAASVAEHINLEDAHYTWLRGELDSDAQALEPESWSVAVDQDYMRALQKEAVRRQDVIYELIQTEVHHVRTLRILKHVYMHELRQSLQVEEARLEGLFSGVDPLLTLHLHFLKCLKLRRSQSLEEGSPNNYQISQLGDVLINQFSGKLGEGMREWYSVFCSHQGEALAFYKEQMQSNKKLQNLIKKIGQLPLVRRLGIPECFLLVTQRITKYPVLVERIIHNTEADTDEHKSLQQGLTLIRDAIAQVNAHVSDYEKALRLKDIYLRLEPKSQGRLNNGRVFRREDINQDKTLLHEGVLSWKSSGRVKDIQAVLLSDVLLLLQEKDQKLVFAAVDNKPPVISLQNLIVREVAHEDRAMFLICSSTATTLELYEMYELHCASREDRINWMKLIWEAVNRYSEEDKLHTELITTLQEYQELLSIKDEQIKRILEEKLHVLASLHEDVTGQETAPRSLLLSGSPSDLQQGAKLLQDAIDEVEALQLRAKELTPHVGEEKMVLGKVRRAETFAVWERNPSSKSLDEELHDDGRCNGDRGPAHIHRTASDPQLQLLGFSESQEQSADGDAPLTNSSAVSGDFPEMFDRMILLAQRLYSLQAVVAQQDSQIELQEVQQFRSKPSRPYSSVLLEQEKQRNLEKQKQELANLHKLQAQHREEQQRWEKDRDRQSVQMEVLEGELKQREEECRAWEEKLKEEKAELESRRVSYQQDLERLRESTRSVEKERERLSQEKERLEHQQEKLKKHLSSLNLGNYEDPTYYSSFSTYPSFRSTTNGLAAYTPIPSSSGPLEVPPKVPPRKESISPQPVKADLPIHLISTTNQVLKPAVVQQQIPTKLLAVSKGKDKGFRVKGHQRTHSAASIDVNQVLPIRGSPSGKEGGSMRAPKSTGPQNVPPAGSFNPQASARSVKTSKSFTSLRTINMEAPPPPPPPPPPPFPSDVLEPGKEKEIFL
ncbi:rho guanine nucleotide exchange factor 18a isoform 2-T3 [Synchiropus picturatus]